MTVKRINRSSKRAGFSHTVHFRRPPIYKRIPRRSKCPHLGCRICKREMTAVNSISLRIGTNAHAAPHTIKVRTTSSQNQRACVLPRIKT
jgi:hypothetical protein